MKVRIEKRNSLLCAKLGGLVENRDRLIIGTNDVIVGDGDRLKISYWNFSFECPVIIKNKNAIGSVCQIDQAIVIEDFLWRKGLIKHRSEIRSF